MPYAVVPVKGGYKVKKLEEDTFMSKRALSLPQAKKQIVAMYLSEMHRKKANHKLYHSIKHNLTGGNHDLLANSIVNNAYKIHMFDRKQEPFVDT